MKTKPPGPTLGSLPAHLEPRVCHYTLGQEEFCPEELSARQAMPLAGRGPGAEPGAHRGMVVPGPPPPSPAGMQVGFSHCREIGSTFDKHTLYDVLFLLPTLSGS